MSRTYFVYVLASEARELYIGVTNNLERRMAEHRLSLDPHSYASHHRTMRLVYYEMTTDVLSAERLRPPPPRFARSQGDMKQFPIPIPTFVKG
jgi:predicted GIY-YIG superfamily endonuclease